MVAPWQFNRRWVTAATSSNSQSAYSKPYARIVGQRSRELVTFQTARLMQVGECLHHHTIGLLEPLRAFRFCSAAPAPHAKPCHDTFVPLSSVSTSSSQRCSQAIASARRQGAATEQLSGERCEHLSQMIEMPDEGRAVRPAMSRIQSIARSNFAGRHRALSSSFHISRTTAYSSLQCAPAVLAAMRDDLFAPRPTTAVMTELRITLFLEWKLRLLLQFDRDAS